MSAEPTAIRAEDLVPVRSRISWGAIFGGAVLSLALYFLLTLLGAATGLSISGHVNAQSLNVGAAIYAVTITCVCLFIGGFYASKLTVGENGVEAAAYGILVWAVVLGALVALMASGVRTGFNAMVGVSTITRADPADWEDAARRAGVPQERINDWRQSAQDAPASARQAIDDPETKKATTRITWYSFIGAWLSMMAAALGGYVGGGPIVRVLAVTKRDVVARPVVAGSV